MSNEDKFIWQDGDLQTDEDADAETLGDKLTQEEAHYEKVGQDPEICENCILFAGPRDCLGVNGTISPKGTCILFTQTRG